MLSEPDESSIPNWRGLSRMGCLIAFAILSAALIAPIVSYAIHFATRTESDTVEPNRVEFHDILFQATVVSLAIGLLLGAKWTGVRTLDEFGFPRIERSDLHVVAIAYGGFAAILVLMIVGATAVGVNEVAITRTPVKIVLKLFEALLSGVLVGLIEETFFRGFLLLHLRRYIGTVLAVAFSTMLYAFAHFIVPVAKPRRFVLESFEPLRGVYELPAFVTPYRDLAETAPFFVTLVVLGLLLSLAALRTRSLFLPIALHAAAVTVVVRGQRLFLRPIPGAEIPIWLAILGAGGAFVLVWRISRSK
jgi:hypothetical protein